MVKVLLTQYSGYPKADSGGPSKVIWQIIDKLSKSDYLASFLSFELEREYSDNAEKSESSENHLSIKKKIGLYFGRNYEWYRKIFLSDFYMYYRFNHIISMFNRKSKKYSELDVIHSHDSFSLAFFSGAKGKKILTIHSKGSAAEELRDYYKSSKLLDKVIDKYKKLEIESINIADIITFPSEAAREMYFGSLGFKPDAAIKIIYNGVDTAYIDSIPADKSLFETLGIPADRKRYYLNVAHHIAPKNIVKIIDALGKIKKCGQNDFCFINVGAKGPESNEISKAVNFYGLEQDCFFLGSMPNNKVLSLMKLCDTFIMASERVVFDLVIIEAMASGMIVIASESGGNLEIIEHGINGYLFNSAKSNNLQEMLSILPSPEVRNSAKITGSKFSIVNTVEKYSELYAGKV